MKNQMPNFDDQIPELEEATSIHPRGGLSAGEKEAFDRLASFAMPLQPLELVHPPKPARTRITIEVQGESIAPKKKTANRFHWFDLVALFSVSVMASAHAGILDLASLWT